MHIASPCAAGCSFRFKNWHKPGYKKKWRKQLEEHVKGWRLMCRLLSPYVGKPECLLTQEWPKKSALWHEGTYRNVRRNLGLVFGRDVDRCTFDGVYKRWYFATNQEQSKRGGVKSYAWLRIPQPLLGNVRLGFPAQDRSEPVQRQFLWACSRVKFLPLPALCRSALRGELLPLAVPPQLETTAMASTNCVVFSWRHQGRVECLFLELSPSHNIHFLRVTRGGRIAWGSVGTWHAFSMPNGPRLCLRSFSCCLGA